MLESHIHLYPSKLRGVGASHKYALSYEAPPRHSRVNTHPHRMMGEVGAHRFKRNFTVNTLEIYIFVYECMCILYTLCPVIISVVIKSAVFIFRVLP